MTKRSWHNSIAAIALALCAAAASAAMVDDMNAAPAFKLIQGDQRGTKIDMDSAPEGGSGKSLKLTWADKHTSFQEMYYAADVAIPGSTENHQGVLKLKLYTETPNLLWDVSARIKDEKGEIFTFSATTPKIEAGKWTDVEITIKPGGQKLSWGGGKTGQMQGRLLVTGLAFGINEQAPAGSMYVDEIRFDTAGEAKSEPAAAPAPTAKVNVDEFFKAFKLEDAHLLAPFWKSTTVRGETSLFIQKDDSQNATATLLFKPGKILRVSNARTGEVYQQGRDYEIDASNRMLVRPSTSTIPVMKQADLYKPKGAKQAIQYKVGDQQTWLTYIEAGFQPQQVRVDYERAEEWNGYKPAFAGDVLPRTLDKLRSKQTLSIAITGDSISAGANATSKNFAPHQPSYPILLTAQLRQTYGTNVELTNTAVGGAMANGAKIEQVIAAKPDLVIIGFGMNDVATKDPAGYGRNIQKIITDVRAALPDAEFILIASSVANPEWNWSPAQQFPAYRAELLKLAGPHIAVADMTTLWSQIIERKRYHDLTGNGINHPNDFGHALYAQVLLGMLVKE